MMQSAFFNYSYPYPKKASDSLYESFLKRLRDKDKISERTYRHIMSISDDDDQIVDYFSPESTRWHRNHSDMAEWYYLCRSKQDVKKD